MVPGVKREVRSLEGALLDGLSDQRHLATEESKVMFASQAETENLAALQKVVKVGGGEFAAEAAVALVIDRAMFMSPTRGPEILPSVWREQRGITGEAGGQDTIKEIDAAGDAVPEVLRGADTHQVPRFRFRQQRRCSFKHLGHHIFCFANAEATNGTAGHICGGDDRRGLLAEGEIHAALTNAKEG